MYKMFRILLFASLILALFTGKVTQVSAASLPAEMNKQFSPLQIDAGGISVMRVTIFNPNTFSLTGASWTDNLISIQPGLFIATPTGIVNTCGGSVTAVVGSTNLSLSGGTVPAQVGSTPGACYVEVNVSSVTTGNLINTIPSNNLVSQGNDGGNIVNITNTTPASATITVAAVIPPSLSKIFNPSTIFVGEVSQLTIRLTNNDTNTDLTGASYIDTLPAGLVVATPNGVSTTNCGAAPIVTALTGGTSIGFSNGTVPASQDCIIRVNVTGASGAYLISNNTANTIPAGPANPGSVHTNQGVTNGSPAQAEITIQPVGIAKAFSPATIAAGDTSVLTITLQNPTGSNYTGVSIADSLPSGLTIAGAAVSNTCGGILTATINSTAITLTNGTIPASATPPTPLGICQISIPVQTSLINTGGTIRNTIPADTLTADQPITNFNPASANLNVNRALIGTKAYSPTTIPLGGTSTVTITLSNQSNTNLTNVNFIDPLTNNLTISGIPATPQCGGTITSTANTVTLTSGTIPAHGNCTITFDVTSNTAGTYDNTIPANSIIDDQNVANPAISTNPDLTVANSTTLPVGLTKAFQTDPIMPGQTSRLRITITAPPDTSISGINITDTLPNGLVIATPNNPNENCPGGMLTAAVGTDTIIFTNTNANVLAAGASCNINVWVTSTIPGLYTNIIPASTLTTIEGRTNDTPASDTIRVTSLTMSKAFYPSFVQAGGRSTLTITLQNSTDSAIINASLTDTLPGSNTNGIRVAAVPNIVSSCGGSVTATPGSNTISMTGGTIPAQAGAIPGVCTISVDVVGLDSTPNTPSSRTNTIPVANVTGTVQATGATISPLQQAQATLTIQSMSIGVVKGFNPVLVYGGASSTLSIQIINPNLNAELTGVAFTDDMTLLGTGIHLANPVDFNVGTCGGLLTGNPGDTFFSFSGGVLPANSTCTLTLNVVMNVNGNLTNRIPAGTVTTFNGVSNPDPTEASLTNLPGVSVSKFFAPNPVPAGVFSNLTIVVQNTTNIPLSGMRLTDNLPGILPAGLVIAPSPAPTNSCGGTLTAIPGTQQIALANGAINASSSCTIVVSVVGSVPGDYQNSITPGALTTNEGVTNDSSAIDTLTVLPNVNGLSKTIMTTSLPSTSGTNVAVGEIMTYQASVTVPPGIYTNAILVDTMQRGLAFVGCDGISAPGLTTTIPGGFAMVCSSPTSSDAGGGTSLDIDRQVTYNIGTLENTGQTDQTLTVTYRAIVLDITTNIDGSILNNSVVWQSDNGPLTPAQTSVQVVEPDMQVQKTADVNFVANGTESMFTLTISHTAKSRSDAYEVVVTDVLPAGLDFVTGSLDCTLGEQDPDPGTCTYDSATRTISAQWGVFTLLPAGDQGLIKFKVQGNSSLPSNGTVTNTANVEWSSLPGDQTTPNSYSNPANPYATERHHDPINTADIYNHTSSVVLTRLGIGGGSGGGNNSNPNSASTVIYGSFLIPVTGFTPDIVTNLPAASPAFYNPLGLSLEIPVLKIDTSITGVQLLNGNWDVSRLYDQAGWLAGTAYPTWSGNSVIMGHITNADGKPGIFSRLKALNPGDYIFINSGGYHYTYKVVSNTNVDPNDISVLGHEEKAYLTLITCDNYSAATGTYLSRTVVRAVLVQVGINK